MNEVKYYDVPGIYKTMVNRVELIGRKHYKVMLHCGYCYKENGSHTYIVERYALYASYGDIDTCVCSECIKSISDRLPAAVRSAVTVST